MKPRCFEMLCGVGEPVFDALTIGTRRHEDAAEGLETAPSLIPRRMRSVAQLQISIIHHFFFSFCDSL